MTNSRSNIHNLVQSSGEPGPFNTALNVMAALSVVFFVCVAVASVQMGTVKADQVGVLINNLTGSMTKVNPGTCFYNSILSDLHILDRSGQTIEMRRVATKETRRGARQRQGATGGGDVKIKTIDGSDVAADIVVNYVIDADKVIEIVSHSGLENAYKKKWAMDYARSVCRNVLGELRTEEFYDSQRRDEKARRSRDILNAELAEFGLEVTAVQVQDFRFYSEYEQKIREKKLSDQEVEEQKSQAKAASERQKRIRIEEEKKAAVDIARFKGEMEVRRVEAEAQAKKARRNVDAYAYTTKIGADARFYESEKSAKGVLATRTAEADGLKSLVSAVEGGKNLVLLEYAEKLKTMTLRGEPFVIDSRTERLQHFGTTGSGVSRSRAGGGAHATTQHQNAQEVQR